MICTYVVRPSDAPEGRGPQLEPFWSCIMDYNLRIGFLFHLIGFILIFLSCLLGGNPFSVFRVLNGDSNVIAKTPLIMTLLGSLLCTIGSFCIQNFRNIADDDASIKQPRGFRAGIKSLNHASMLDLLSYAMTSVLILSLMHFFEDEWASKRAGSSSTALMFSIARTMHALSLIFYGSSFFLLENFHIEGTSELWGWILILLFYLAGLFELLALVVSSYLANAMYNFLFTLTLGGALIFSFIWSLAFEPLVIHTNVKFTQSGMRNEFYKSRNAMAYYGPPTGIEMRSV